VKLTSDKDLNALLRDAAEKGWVFIVTPKHIKARHPSGKTATISKTPSDSRTLKNVRSYLKVS
jgi:hypothetical protein